jgi:hypothetical protein
VVALADADAAVAVRLLQQASTERDLARQWAGAAAAPAQDTQRPLAVAMSWSTTAMT